MPELHDRVILPVHEAVSHCSCSLIAAATLNRREHKRWWMAMLGALVLIGYGFVPTAQPVDSFGRIYAVYGGFFIILSYLWGWAVDGDRPDTGARQRDICDIKRKTCLATAVCSPSALKGARQCRSRRVPQAGWRWLVGATWLPALQ